MEPLFIQKYQPLLFDQFECQNDLFSNLKELIKINMLNILFIGNPASGKTTILNAIVREYYNDITPKEYNENVLYINSLKEQGINYYRTDVKTFCQTCCTIKNKKKIIVLDDIDIINEQSQQVFRNCIDKYSHNVNFISSCINSQKVIESLQSRFFIIKLESLTKQNIYNIIHKIKHAENIDIDSDAEDFIVNVSKNTVKIAINYMEKFKLIGEKITLSIANELCTNINFLVFEKYTQLLKSHNLKEAIQLIYEIYNKGYSVMDILDNYFLFVKSTTVIDEKEKYDYIPIICKYITIFHNIHEDPIELALFTNNLIQLYKK